MSLRIVFGQTSQLRTSLSAFYTTRNILQCRHSSNTKFPQNRSKLGYVVGGAACLLVGVGAGSILREPLITLWKENKHSPVLAETNSRQKFNIVADILQNNAKGIVAIDAWFTLENNRKIYDYGVGFVEESSELLITNDTLIKFNEDKYFQAIFEDGSAYYAKFVSLDNHSDLAALRLCDDQGKILEKGKVPTVKLNTSPLRLGDKMIAVTMKQRDDESSIFKVFCGYLSNSQIEGSSGPLLLMSTNTIVDGYGGPVLNTDGEVVGMVTPQEQAGASLSIPYSYVQKFIERSLKHEKMVLKKEEDMRRERREAKEREEEKQRKERDAWREERKRLLEEEESK